MKIAIYGGSFNPVHNGHMAVCALVKNYVDEVIMIPTEVNPLKNTEYYSEDFRLKLIRAAISVQADSDKIHCTTVKNSKYLIDVLREFRRNEKILQSSGIYHPLDDVDLYFVVGTDSAATVDRWKDKLELQKFTSFLVVKRPGVEVDWKTPLQNNGISFEYIDEDIPEISSTDIRERLKKNQSVYGWVPTIILGALYKEELNV